MGKELAHGEKPSFGPLGEHHARGNQLAEFLED